MVKHPMVIWQGHAPIVKNPRSFRIVDRGPARQERPDDVPFALECKTGLSMMKTYNWAVTEPQNNPAQAKEAIWALSHAMGLLLTVDPKRLYIEHPLYCEMNLAVAEQRESKGCDCPFPNDPDRRVE
jgi:hypothetical protein